MIVSKDFFIYVAGFLVAIDITLISAYLKYVYRENAPGDINIKKFKYKIILLMIISVPAVVILYAYGTSESPGDIPTGFDDSSFSKSTVIYNNIGYNHYKAKQYEKAIESLDKALEQDPDYALAWGNKGEALEELGRQEEADEAFDKARRLQL